MNEQSLVAGKFEWQMGTGALTIGQSKIKSVVNYILNQEQHDRMETFREERTQLL
jgi:hypothetical protein